MKGICFLKVIMMMVFVIPNYGHALVEYGEASSFTPPPTKAASASQATNTSVRKTSPSKTIRSTGFFDLTTGFRTFDVSSQYGEGSVSQYYFEGHFQTPFNFFVDFNHWMGSTDDQNISSKESTQQGNPEVKLGFNWLRFGKASEMSTINIIAGYSPGNDSSDLAASRDDQFYGVETTKRFHDFVLGIAYHYKITGNPDREDELSIGNIQSIVASLGWKATPDIGFAVEAATSKINRGEDEQRILNLDEEISYGYVSPKLMLGISPLIQLEMGALFRTKRAEINEEILKARLWNLKGLYGNNLFASMNISI